MTDEFSSGIRDKGDEEEGVSCPVPHVHEYWSDQLKSQR